jgi:hypothetical protein
MGDVELIQPITRGHEGPEEAEVSVSVRDMESEVVDYVSFVSLTLGTGGTRDTSLGGFVESAVPEADRVHLNLVSATTRMAEQGTGGVDPWLFVDQSKIWWLRELAWTIIRMSGVPESRIHIPFMKPAAEPFLVVAPIEGMAVGFAKTIGSVQVSADAQFRDFASRSSYPWLRDQYMAGEAWASARVWAQTAFDAELRGLEAIDHALSWIIVRSRYSSASLPSGTCTHYLRAATRARVNRRPFVLVRGDATARGYLRGLDDIERFATLQLDLIADFAVPRVSENLTQQDREAMSFYRQAVNSSDPISKVVLLVTALEFYTAAIRVPDAFDRPTRRAARKRAAQGLTARQRERLVHVFGFINEPSFSLRLKAACDEDAVPLTSKEIEILGRIRILRNWLMHGKVVQAPGEDDLAAAMALVNRMLVCRVYRVGSASGSP